MKMRSILCTVLVFTISQYHSHAQSSDEQILRHIKEVEWPKAYREQDTALLDKILAGEFQMIGSDGEYSTKKEQIQYIKTHKPNYISFKFEIKRLEIFENGTAIVSGTGTIRRKDDKGEYDLIYQSSNVLIKRDNEWKAVSSHTSGDRVVR